MAAIGLRMNITYIEIPPLKLNWSEWHEWASLSYDARFEMGAVRLPSFPGVYEARYRDVIERLTIGKAANLRHRVKQGLVKGKTQHSTGKRIREQENVSEILIRWAETDRPAAVEEELHKQHKMFFGRLPKHTKVT